MLFFFLTGKSFQISGGAASVPDGNSFLLVGGPLCSEFECHATDAIYRYEPQMDSFTLLKPRLERGKTVHFSSRERWHFVTFTLKCIYFPIP